MTSNAGSDTTVSLTQAEADLLLLVMDAITDLPVAVADFAGLTEEQEEAYWLLKQKLVHKRTGTRR